MPESYLDAEGHLLPEVAWRSFVDSLHDLPSLADKAKIEQELAALLGEAIKTRLPGPKEKIGLLFSGGVDSTLIAFLLKRLGIPFLAITVGFQDGDMKAPEDVVEAERFATALGLEQESIVLDDARIAPLFKRVAAILGEELLNVVNMGVGAVEVAAIERGKELGITHFFGGLGSEEIFAGYDRHEKAWTQGGEAALHEECLRGLGNVHGQDLRRSAAIAEHLGVTLATPFLDPSLLRFSMRIPASLKITDASYQGEARGDLPASRRYKKMILRETAEMMGLPHEMAFRPKRATQYGSRTNNALTRLRKEARFQDKMAYVRSLLP